MDLFKKLVRPSPSKANVYTFAVKCNRCGEIIEGRVNLNNDLSVDHHDGKDGYFVRKVLMGGGRCFQQIEVELRFGSSKQLLEKHVTGGTFVE